MGTGKTWEKHRAECEALASPGLTITGYVEPWNFSSTVIEFECKEHGKQSKRLSKFKESPNCKQCSAEQRRDVCRKIPWKENQEKITAILKPGGCSLVGYQGEYKGHMTVITMCCPTHGNWSTKLVQIVKLKTGCPSCALVSAPASRIIPWEVYKKQCEAALTSDVKILGYVPPFRGVHTKVIANCEYHGEFTSTSIDNMKRGKGCPLCAGHSQQQAYISIIGNDFEWWDLKFGIAKDSVRRLGAQLSKAKGLQLRSEAIYTFPTVEACKSAERAVKQRYKAYLGSVPRHLLPDGFTETLPIIYIGAVTRVYEEFGGVRMKPKLKKSIKKQMNY